MLEFEKFKELLMTNKVVNMELKDCPKDFNQQIEFTFDNGEKASLCAISPDVAWFEIYKS
jgi:hypothetical protein